MTAAILYDNAADAGLATASSWLASAPPSRLQDAHTTRRWEGRLGASEFVLVTFSPTISVDTIALLKCAGVFSGVQRNLSAAATRRIRISSADITGVAGDLYDSGSASGFIDPKYGAVVSILPAPISGVIAIRIDLAEAGADALQAGRLVAGLRNSFSINFQYGWSFGYSDLSRLRKSAGGQTFVDRDDRFRVLSVTFDAVAQSERDGFVGETDRLNGISQDVLFITDENTTNPTRDSVWGLMQDMNPPTQPYFDRFNKSYSVQERL